MKTSNTWKERYEIEKDGKGILLVTNGDANYIFQKGNFSCGDARCYGVSARRQGDEGGVITLDEIVRLRDFLNEHIEQVMPKKWYEFWK